MDGPGGGSQAGVKAICKRKQVQLGPRWIYIAQPDKEGSGKALQAEEILQQGDAQNSLQVPLQVWRGSGWGQEQLAEA